MSNENVNIENTSNDEVVEVRAEDTNIEENVEEILAQETDVNEHNEDSNENIKVKKEKNPILSKIGVSAIDQFILICMSMIGMGVLIVLLKLFGFQIVHEYKTFAYLIIYIIFNILYVPVCMLGGFKATIAGKILS